MRFRLVFDPSISDYFYASGAADLFFAILDKMQLNTPPVPEVNCTLEVEHLCGLIPPRWLTVWSGTLPTERAKLTEWLDTDADKYPPTPVPPTRAVALWQEAVSVRLQEALKGR